MCGEARGNEYGCGQYFCEDHLVYKEIDGETHQLCERCAVPNHDGTDEIWPEPFPAKPEHPDWLSWQMTDPSWADWRQEQGFKRHADMPFDESAPWYRFNEIRLKELQYEEQTVSWKYWAFKDKWLFLPAPKEGLREGQKLTPTENHPGWEFNQIFSHDTD